MAELFTILSRIKGKFLMSFDACDEARTLAKKLRLHVRPVSVRYTLGSSDHKLAPEVLVSNYPLRLCT